MGNATSRRGRLLPYGGLLVLAAAVLSGCGRESAAGSSDINRGLATPDYHAQNFTVPNRNRMYGYGAEDGANTGIAARTGIRADSPVEESRTIARAVDSLEEIKSSEVLVINQNIYAAVVMNYGTPAAQMEDPVNRSANLGDVSERVKARITEKARAARPDIRYVYVSAHPDFVECVSALAAQIRSGGPSGGYMQQLATIVSRLS